MNMEMILDAVFFRIWNMSITAGYCILAVLLLRLLLHKLPRKYLYMLWLAAAFRLICPVSVGTRFSLFNLEPFPGSWSAAEYAADAWTGSQEIPKERPEGTVPAKTEGPPDERQEIFYENVQEPHSLKAYVRDLVYLVRKGQLRDSVLWRTGKYVWAAGVLVFAVYLAVSAGRLRALVRRAVRVKGSGPDQDRIYECAGLPSPFAAGVFRPRIYLPCGLSEAQKEIVLLHEQVHIRRKDHLVKYFSFLLLAVYWFHPLVWAAWAGMCRDMEMSCDERVLELLGEGRRKEYSRTLLELASECPASVRMPPAFGEQDVEKRIRHVLRFQKPAFWAGAAAMAVLLALLLLLGTDQAPAAEDAELSKKEEVWEHTAALYDAGNPYVGDASADGRLIGAISEAYPGLLISKTPFKTELQTSEEPYEFHFLLETEPPAEGLERELSELDMTVTAALMLTLTDNLGVVRWSYVSPEGETLSEGGSVDAAEAAKWCGAEDIKAFAESEERLQCLLDRIEGLYIRPWDSSLPFMSWYADISPERYEQAVPIDDEAYEQRGEEDPCMFILAQTEDQTVTVYGCSSTRLGDRGLTLVCRDPGQEEPQYIFVDENYWGGRLTRTRTKVYRTDTDQDGTKEIVLQRQNSEGEIRETTFKPGADGIWEAIGEPEDASGEQTKMQGE